MPEQSYNLSLIVLTDNSFNNWVELLSSIRASMKSLDITYEILVPASGASSSAFLHENECITFTSHSNSYGDITREGIKKAAAEYIITMDAGQNGHHGFLCDLWNARESAEILIGSRYAPNGEARMPPIRKLLSRLLNMIFSRGLDLSVRDMSSGFRLYRSHVAKGLVTQSVGYDVLQEILVKALMEGYQIKEIPFHYQSEDPAYGRIIQFGLAYFKTFTRLWKLRNSIASADYDARAYNALMPPQRYWQRQRYKIITELIHNNGNEKCLDVGCGSSRIIGRLPNGSIALDILLRKLRFARRFGHVTVQGSIFNLPIPDRAFPCVLCSQVIEHVPRANVLDELDRVLQPGGFLILGTPDYDRWQWIVIEWLYKILLPQAYADEHITHYTYKELVGEFVSKRGYQLETFHYILKGELILELRKPL